MLDLATVIGRLFKVSLHRYGSKFPAIVDQICIRCGVVYLVSLHITGRIEYIYIYAVRSYMNATDEEGTCGTSGTT